MNALLLGKPFRALTNPSFTLILWDPGGLWGTTGTNPSQASQMTYLADHCVHNGGSNQMWGDCHIALDSQAHYFRQWTWGVYWPFHCGATCWHPNFQ